MSEAQLKNIAAELRRACAHPSLTVSTSPSDRPSSDGAEVAVGGAPTGRNTISDRFQHFLPKQGTDPIYKLLFCLPHIFHLGIITGEPGPSHSDVYKD